jgi:predicted NBD/HSP70 family sugar kinase
VTHTLEVLEALCRRPEASRSELADVTGLSAASISRAVAHLRREGLVDERDAPAAGVGRPPRVVRLRPGAAHVVGIDAGGSRVRVVLTDLEGRVVARASATVGASLRVDAVVRSLTKLANDVATRAGAHVVAAGAGISGIVDASAGKVLLSPDLPSLGGKDVAVRLADALGVPVAIDNDDLLAAAGEAAFGAAQGCAEVAFLSLGHGLGAGLVVGGRPVHGARASAGAIAYLAPYRLEERASGRAIPRRYLELRGADVPGLRAERVFELAEAGDADARAVVDDAVVALGDLVVNVAALLDPEVIVLGGGLVRGQPTLRDRLAGRLVDTLPFPPRLVVSELGEDAVARGAASLALTLAQRRLSGVSAEPGRLGALEFV